MEIIHGLTLLPGNSRMICIIYHSGCYEVIDVISNKIMNFKYKSIEGTSFDDQYKYLLKEYKDQGFKIRIGHPITTELRDIISTMLTKDNTHVTFDFNSDKDEFRIIMHSSIEMEIHDILDRLNLVHVHGITVDFIDHHDSREIGIKFDSPNVYNKLKLIGTIERIHKIYELRTIILPHSYMEFLEYTDKNNCVHTYM